MMTIGNIEVRHLGKFCGDGFDILIIAYNPELMVEAIDGAMKSYSEFCSGIAHQNLIEYRIIRISKRKPVRCLHCRHERASYDPLPYHGG